MRQDVAIVADVEEELSGTLFRLAGEIGQQIVAVDMHLVGLVSDLVAFEELRRDVRLSRGSQKRRQPVLV